MTHLPRWEEGRGGQSAMVTSNNAVFSFDFAPFGLSLLPPPTPPSANCNLFPGRRHNLHSLSQETASSPDQHAPAVVDPKMFDIEASGLRWFFFFFFLTSSQTKRKNNNGANMSNIHTVFLLFLSYSTASSVITGPLLWIAISTSGNTRTLWEEQESRWTNIKRERNKQKKINKFHSPHKYCALRSRQINK